MRLLPRRKSAATLTLSPEHGLPATESLTATVTLTEPLDAITAARVELGYVNTYRYHWAGRRDAAMRHDDTSLVTMGQVGTSHGSDRETEDWVAVLDQALPVSSGVLDAGSHAVQLRLPSWAPGSSESTVRWLARLRIERDGRDVQAEQAFDVVVGAPDPPPADLPLIQGEVAMSNTLAFDIVTERPCYRAGEEVRGSVSVTPRELGRNAGRPAELGVWFMSLRSSHPLEKTPGDTTESFVRPMVTVAKDLALTDGVTVEIPFAVVLSEDVDPTTAAVHSSLDWFVQARISFAGATGGIERARRGIVVYTA